MAAFLEQLAVSELVACGTQRQALNALVYFHGHALKLSLGKIESREGRSRRLVGLTRPPSSPENRAMRVDIKGIWISPGHDFVGRFGMGRENHGQQACDCVQCVAGKGIEGDRYFGHKEDFKGQITFFSNNVADELEKAFNLPQLDRSAMRRNVLISGIDLNSLIGKRFRLGGVVLSGSEECAPCVWMNTAVAEGAHEFLKGNGGLRCRIHKSGTLSTGETELEILEEKD